jgi:NADH:ubiquinone oxidoreductase subunit 3 (chain A)
LNAFIGIGLTFLAAVLFAVAAVVASRVLSPRGKHTDRAKLEVYESGIIPRQDAHVRFPVRFYLVVLLFLIFDVEIAFLYPWALRVKELGMVGVVEIGLFVGMLLVAYVYFWRRGGLQWQ